MLVAGCPRNAEDIYFRQLMRPIGEISREEHAQLFGDYLYVQGIANDIEEDEGAWTIWIHDDDLISKAEIELARFLKNPEAADYRKHAKKAARMRQAEEEEAELAHKRQVDVRTQVFNTPTLGTPHFTFALIGLSILVWLMFISEQNVSSLYISNIHLKVAAQKSMSVEEQVKYRLTHQFLPEITGKPINLEGKEQVVGRGEVWRVVTPIFLHFSWMHIIFNMYMLYILGGLLEGRLGLGYMLVFVLVTAIFSNLGQYCVNGPSFGGMSGVNYGLFGYLWLRGKNDPSFGIQLDEGTIMILMGWFVLCFTGLLGNIANAAHTLGLITGASWGWLAARRSR